MAYKLGIPHYVMNFRDVFAQKVIADFCQEYSLGRTPNPCIKCNQYIKWDALLTKAKALGADFIATGHYARVKEDKTKGRYLLQKGIDLGKDQSYVLYPLSQEQLKSTLMPLGNLTKEETRQIAKELGLPVAAKPESQEICFIPNNDYPSFLKDCIPDLAKPGPILDEQGNILGNHRGIPFYTVGQRKGLGISAGIPLYVVAIEPDKNAIIVGTEDKVFGEELTAFRLNWISIAKLTEPIMVKAKIRYRHQEAEAVITPLDGDRVYVKFSQSQWAITPGQAIVFYDGDVVIGGGTIETANKPTKREMVNVQAT